MIFASSIEKKVIFILTFASATPRENPALMPDTLGMRCTNLHFPARHIISVVLTCLFTLNSNVKMLTETPVTYTCRQEQLNWILNSPSSCFRWHTIFYSENSMTLVWQEYNFKLHLIVYLGQCHVACMVHLVLCFMHPWTNRLVINV